MAKLKVERWTLVQHSGYGYGEKPGWEHAVEEKLVGTERDLLNVTNEGGMIFESYSAADDACMKENYPEGSGDTLTYPYAKGTFSDKEIDGLKIYIPAKQPVG